MKRYTEMTDAELLVADCEKLIMLEMAEEGILVVPCPVKPVHVQLVKPTVEAWSVGDVIFGNPADAATFCGLAVLAKGYDYQISYSMNYLTPRSDLTVRKELFYRSEDLALARAELLKQAKEMAAYDKSRKTFDEFTRATQGIRDDVYTAIADAHDRARAQERAISDYKGYLELAENNHVIASRFLAKAYSGRDVLIAHVDTWRKATYPEAFA